MFPSQSVIIHTFAPQHPLNQSKRQPQRSGPVSRRQPFPAWSVADDGKKLANDFANEAAREYNLASQKAQEKAGKIEPWTMKYYAACTFGGLMACVCQRVLWLSSWPVQTILKFTGPDAHGGHTS